jgi:heterodisulfide reductase subunit B
MKVSYYPGCTLKSKARSLEEAALSSLSVLGVEVEELPRWNCCGAVHSLTQDDLIHQVAPVRDLIRTLERGSTTLVTLCSMCYNSLSRANRLMREDPVKQKTINDFMDEEIDYKGEVEVLHFLTFLRDHVGWGNLRQKVVSPLEGLRVAPYYGCTLLRPSDVSIEPGGSRSLFSDFLTSLGAEPVTFPAEGACCGSYQVLAHPDAADSAAASILSWAKRSGANTLALSCPLCEYNLSGRQEGLIGKGLLEGEIPTLYFTQLLALALGVEQKDSPPLALLGGAVAQGA